MPRTLRQTAPMERVLRDIIRRDLLIDGQPVDPAAVGRDLPGSLTGLYVRLEKIGGSSGETQGDFVFDIETFHPNYNRAESAQYALEALLLGYPRSVVVDDRKVVLDFVTQNQGPSEIFWDDDSVHRLLATYVITARR